MDTWKSTSKKRECLLPLFLVDRDMPGVTLGHFVLEGSKMVPFCFKVTVAKATVQRPPGLASKRRESVNPILSHRIEGSDLRMNT